MFSESYLYRVDLCCLFCFGCVSLVRSLVMVEIFTLYTMLLVMFVA